MKQVLQSLKNGDTQLADVPAPHIKAGHVLIRTHQSLISPGTEKMLKDFGNASMLQKARQQPDKIRMVVDKIKSVGLLTTLDAVRSKLNQMLPMGYCNLGTVIGVGAGVTEFSVGDRVVSNGAHAEIVCVAKNLCCKVPAEIPDEQAVFTVLGAIALQGIRLAVPTLGETFVVIGLGLIGLLTVQLLRAQGCRVLGIDLDAGKVELAQQFGVNAINVTLGVDPVIAAQEFSRGRGVDGVIITASTKNNEPIRQAANMCRQRGRIILVGITGLELSRADFYKKELTFQVSCSYGPGRYDASYEEQGNDYPVGFVRWTQQRNFEAFLDMLAHQTVKVEPLITHRYPIEEASAAYDLLADRSLKLGILLTYPQTVNNEPAQTIKLPAQTTTHVDKVSLGVIGAGNYASRVLIPAFKQTDSQLNSIACSAGISGAQIGKKYGFQHATTDVSALFANEKINTIIIATRHDTHADFVCEALRNNKNVFVEKPLCLSLQELTKITDQYTLTPNTLMVGFNRRFAPQIQKIKSLLAAISEPKSFIMTVNAGDIPADHWTQTASGGGRINGEACHFIDLLRFLAGSPIASFQATRLNNVAIRDDKVSITLSFEDGSFGVINYLANGHHAVSKERLEIFAGGKILQLDNFLKLRGHGWSHFKKMNLFRQDKGQHECVSQFVHAIKNALPAPIPATELFEVCKVTLQIANSLT